MAYQIIEQPDGHLAIFSSVVDGWVAWNGTDEEVIEFFVQQAADRARKDAAEKIALVRDRSPLAYFQFALTFEDADRIHREHGHAPIDLEGAE